jgi:glutathione synthase/RimK-type ligase-like ATP-grasp enzyme
MKKITKGLLLIFYWLLKLNWIDFLKNYDTKSKNVVYITFFSKKFSNEILSWDFSAITFFIKNNLSFRLALNMNEIKNSFIVWSPSVHMVSPKIKNYSKELASKAINVENKNNHILPSSKEILLYENKAYMYDYFKKCGIHYPKTWIFSNIEEILDSIEEFPLILKGEFSSGSKDVYKFNNNDDLIKFLNKGSHFISSEKIILQEFIDLRKDLRATFVAEDLVLYYWRKNPSTHWKPTASSFGSEIDFLDYPYRWHDFILNEFKKLKMPMGAFDIGWKNDDMKNKPYILEFSPRFSPNPVFKNDVNIKYKIWKTELFRKKSFWKAQANIIEKINHTYLNNFNKKENDTTK